MQRSVLSVDDYRAIRSAYILEFQRLFREYCRLMRPGLKHWNSARRVAVARIFHQLKGESSFAGYYQIAGFSYAMECMIGRVAESADPEGRVCYRICRAAQDVLRSYLVDVISGRSELATDASEVLGMIASSYDAARIFPRKEEEHVL